MTLFSGDAFNPSLESSVTKGKHMVPALNALETTVSCLGNHDLDFGVDQFKYLAKLCKFPWLCANVLDPALGENVPLGNCKPTVMITSSNGIKVGFIGLVEREWLDTINTLPPDLQYLSASATALKLVPKLREEGAEIVIAVTHQREPNDNKLAEKLPPGTVDMVLGGHDHFYGHSHINGTHVLRSGTDFRQLSYIEARRKADGSKGWDFNITRRDVTSDVPEDPIALRMVEKLTLAMKAKLDKAIGYIAAPLDARFTTVRLKESNMGNFVCDLMRYHYHAECALVASGTIRGDQIYPPGVLRVKDIMNCFPFEDPCVVIAMKGKDIVAALENGVSSYPALEGRFPQVSGIEFTFDANKPPGDRCYDIWIADEEVELERVYKVATRDYMVRGKDGFTSMVLEEDGGPAKSIISEEDGLLISQVLRQYFMSLKVLGMWKKWSNHLGSHWDGIHDKLHDVHPVRDAIKPEEDAIMEEPEELERVPTQAGEGQQTSAQHHRLSSIQHRHSTHHHRHSSTHHRHHSSSHHRHESTTLSDHDSDSEDDTSHLPPIPTDLNEQERNLIIMRKFVRRWWRKTGLPGHPNMLEDHGEEYGVHWTRAIAPREEGRITIVNPAS